LLHQVHTARLMVCSKPRPCLLAMLLQQDCMQHDDSSQSEVKVTFTSTKETCTMSAFTICTLNAQPRKVTACKKQRQTPAPAPAAANPPRKPSKSFII